MSASSEHHAAIALSINDLDRQIEQHVEQLRRARKRRRELRVRLKSEGWSWREIGALSGQTMFAVQKDAARSA